MTSRKKWLLKWKFKKSQVLVYPACNTSYSGGWDQENCGSKPSLESCSWDPSSKILNTNKSWHSGSICRVACLASMKPRDQTSVPVKNKTKQNPLLCESSPLSSKKTACTIPCLLVKKHWTIKLMTIKKKSQWIWEIIMEDSF
jgi:hypothetical protein